ADGTRHVTAAFDVEDDGGARLTRKYVACVKNQLAVGPDDLPGFGDHADTVRVAVESQAQLTVRCHDMADQVLQVVRIGGIGVVIGEVAVDVAEQRVDFTAERAEQALRQDAAHAVAAVQRHAHGALQLEITGHASDVVPYDIHGFALARHGGRFTAGQFHHEGLQVLDIVAVQCAAGHHHLEAVVVGRIVAACDGHAGSRLAHMRREIHQGRRHHADVHRVHAL